MTLVQRAVGQDRLLAFAAIVVVVVVVSSWPLASPSNAQESQQRARFLSAAPCFACTLHASTAVAYVVSYTHIHTHISRNRSDLSTTAMQTQTRHWTLDPDLGKIAACCSGYEWGPREGH
ncbi:hypothetical protein CPAR01_13901 [Colletotrichum paranaense]|uniref:Secreted protein n=1 Tax=Colletotrichum paranaense TaxID=1914294 RepID=A0ABQ9S2J6_9PEZI|nr:uncharacterized protein CPAR01_13901 [Colletotrichum paranaense]KAK1523048.1 hypothetical protein CPAR01_13901 [Colletotrichum paranaense]